MPSVVLVRACLVGALYCFSLLFGVMSSSAFDWSVLSFSSFRPERKKPQPLAAVDCFASKKKSLVCTGVPSATCVLEQKGGLSSVNSRVFLSVCPVRCKAL